LTDVAFHTGIEDPLEYACRLLRKAYRGGSGVAVHGTDAFLERLDQALWTFEPLEFIAHAVLPRDAGDAGRLARSPIVLVHAGAEAPARAVAVAVGAAWSGDASAYERVIEVVGLDAQEREAGRRRWRDHERAGHALTHVATG
jgi:DNA polymerase-3 subunit chi